MMKKTNLTFSVAIPTCYGGKTLVSAIASIRNSRGVDGFPILVRADSIPIPTQIKKKLQKLSVTLTQNKTPGSQMHKIKQLLAECKTDIFISTQDDIRFSEDVITRIVDAFQSDSSITMVGVSVLPETQTTITERVVRTGPLLAQAIGKNLNNGDNYLVSNGRCLAFRTSFFKKFRMPKGIVNSDGYFYLENKRLGGKFKFIPKAKVYIQSPKSMKEHLNQSTRFQYSEEELQLLFDESISLEYTISKRAVVGGAIDVFMRDPLAFVLYGFVLIYTRLKRKSTKTYNKVYWGVDYSTKRT